MKKWQVELLLHAAVGGKKLLAWEDFAQADSHATLSLVMIFHVEEHLLHHRTV